MTLLAAADTIDAPSAAPVLVNLKLHFLQQWRLVQAMAEGSRTIALQPEFAPGIEHLRRFFPTRLQAGDGTPTPPGFIGIDTLGPTTKLGGVSRALIVPHAIVDYCRSLWPDERRIRFSFAGLNHWGRNSTLRRWHADQFGTPATVQTLADSASLMTVVEAAAAESPNGAAIVFSKRGRSFPRKVWDDEYYRLLANSAFSLCPDGDQIWSYRFFEACLCGAMPIVQSDWPSYAGFRYHKLSDPAERLTARIEDQVHNFALATSRLTVPIDELNATLRDL